jgi:hypothetical protein
MLYVSHNESAFNYPNAPRAEIALIPAVLIGIGSLATFYLTALIVWGISISVGIL